MKKLAIAAAVLMLAGCASAPKPSVIAPKKKTVVQSAQVDQTPNQAVKKRWMPKFKIKWLHSK